MTQPIYIDDTHGRGLVYCVFYGTFSSSTDYCVHMHSSFVRLLHQKLSSRPPMPPVAPHADGLLP